MGSFLGDLFGGAGSAQERQQTNRNTTQQSSTVGQQAGSSGSTQTGMSTGLQSLTGSGQSASRFNFESPEAQQLVQLALQGASGANGTGDFFQSLMNRTGPSEQAQQSAQAIRDSAEAQLPGQLAETRRAFFRTPNERGVSALQDTAARNRLNAETAASNVLLQDTARQDNLGLQGAAGLQSLAGSAQNMLPMFGEQVQTSQNEQMQQQEQQQLMQELSDFINNFSSQTEGSSTMESETTGSASQREGLGGTLKNLGVVSGIASLI